MMPADYRLFASIVERGSLSAAARAANLSAAMVSKRLQRLEDRLGTRLLTRTTRRLALTSAGERFYSDVQGILRAIDEAEERVGGGDGEPRGALRVTAPASFARMHIAPHLVHFMAAHPKVNLSFDATDDVVDLLQEGIDVAIRITAKVPAGTQATRLANNQRVLCASPDYIAKRGEPRSIAELGAHSLLAAKGQLPWRLMRRGKLQLVEGPSLLTTNSSDVIRELALSGAGIALRSLWDVDGLLQSGALVPLLREWHAPDDLALHALTPQGSQSPAAAAFIAFIKATLTPAQWDIPPANAG